MGRATAAKADPRAGNGAFIVRRSRVAALGWFFGVLIPAALGFWLVAGTVWAVTLLRHGPRMGPSFALILGSGVPAALLVLLWHWRSGLFAELGPVRPGGVVLVIDGGGVRLGGLTASRRMVIPWDDVAELVVTDHPMGRDESGTEVLYPYLVVRRQDRERDGGDPLGWGPSRPLIDVAADRATAAEVVGAAVRRLGPAGVVVSVAP